MTRLRGLAEYQRAQAERVPKGRVVPSVEMVVAMFHVFGPRAWTMLQGSGGVFANSVVAPIRRRAHRLGYLQNDLTTVTDKGRQHLEDLREG